MDGMGTSRRDMLKTGALGVGALAGMSAVSASAASAASASESSILAASDFFLKIEGVEGESTDAKHAGEIEIESFSWGAQNTPGISKVNFQDFHFTTRTSKASPVLMLACASGKHFSKAVLTVRKAGEIPVEYYKVTLEDLLVTSHQSGGSAGSEVVPMEQVSINFTKITFSYTPQKADGSLGSPVVTTWPR